MKLKLLVLIVFIVVLFSSCTGGSGHITWELTASESSTYLPDAAMNVVGRGNGWVEFDLDENRYLFYYRKLASGRASAITQIK